jgi:trigger factor
MELIQNREGIVATLTVKVSQEDYVPQVEKGLRKTRQTAQMKGFRQGNVPMSIIKKMYGQAILVEEINKLVLELLGNYEEENKGNLVGRVIPVNINQWSEFEEYKDFEFVYETCFYPEFTYKIDENTELPYYNIIIEDKTIDEEIDYYRNTYRVPKKKDTVEDDCLIQANVNIIKEGEEKMHNAKFFSSVIPDEYKSLFFGAKVDDVINVELRKVFTNESDLMGMLDLSKEDLDLQSEVIPFTIVEISKSVQAEMNQEFFDIVAGKNGNIHSEEELRDYVRNHITADYEMMSLNKLYIDSIEILKSKIDFDLPKDYVAKYLRYLQKEGENPSEEQFEMFVQYFIDDTKWKYIVKSLFLQNNIDITPEMVKDEAKAVIKETYGDYGYYKMDELVDYYLSNEESLHSIMTRVHRRQLANILKQYAKLNVTNVTADEFNTICNNKENKEEEQE